MLWPRISLLLICLDGECSNSFRFLQTMVPGKGPCKYWVVCFFLELSLLKVTVNHRLSRGFLFVFVFCFHCTCVFICREGRFGRMCGAELLWRSQPVLSFYLVSPRDGTQVLVGQAWWVSSFTPGAILLTLS